MLGLMLTAQRGHLVHQQPLSLLEQSNGLQQALIFLLRKKSDSDLCRVRQGEFSSQTFGRAAECRAEKNQLTSRWEWPAMTCSKS